MKGGRAYFLAQHLFYLNTFAKHLKFWYLKLPEKQVLHRDILVVQSCSSVSV